MTQNVKPADRSALHAQCEPLLAVAEAHADGKEAFARSIATELFSDFLSVEERFAANKEATEQEVIDSLRQVISLPSSITFVQVLCRWNHSANATTVMKHHVISAMLRHGGVVFWRRYTAPTWRRWWTLW